jgi:CheY-like chemotaxis protein
MLRGVHVLVAGADARTRDVLAALLTYAGAFVIDAASARETLAALQRHRPHVVLADVELADETSTWLLAQIRALEGEPIPIVALTGGGETALDAEFATRLRKPADPWALCRLLADLARKA